MYVLHVRCNKENQVKDALEEMGFSALHPTAEIIIRSKKQWKLQIKSISGVIRFLGDVDFKNQNLWE